MSRLTLQQILLKHGASVIKTMSLPLLYLKVLDKLTACRTALLGGHAQYCANGHLNGIWYNSCKHRFCPQCRGVPTEEWLKNTKALLLDCAHHHIVFTLPSALDDLWRYNQSVMTDILFKASQQTLQSFSKDPKYLNATLGILCVLHTWGRSLCLHPHIHAVVSHGGLNALGEWIIPRKSQLFPQKPVMMVYRGKLLSMMKAALKEGRLLLPPDRRESQVRQLLNKLGRKDWVVHFCDRYEHAKGVAKYLSRYVKSGPLKNHQLVSANDEQVTFAYQSHETKKRETLTLPVADFIRRILQHTPLRGKPTVRYSGLYNSATRKKLNIAREALGQKAVKGRESLDWEAFMTEKGTFPTCEICGLRLTQRKLIAPVRRVA